MRLLLRRQPDKLKNRKYNKMRFLVIITLVVSLFGCRESAVGVDGIQYSIEVTGFRSEVDSLYLYLCRCEAEHIDSTMILGGNAPLNGAPVD